MERLIEQLHNDELAMRQAGLEIQIRETRMAMKELFGRDQSDTATHQERDSTLSMTHKELEARLRRQQEDLVKVVARQVGPVPGYSGY